MTDYGTQELLFDDASFTSDSDTAGIRIAGVDEVGRGPLAGPVVAVALVLPDDLEDLPQLRDSKKMTQKAREESAAFLQNNDNIAIGIGVIEPREIDRLNIYQATVAAMATAIIDLPIVPDLAYVDGKPVKGLPVRSKAFVGGDALYPVISAASIVAKVHRDNLMLAYDKQFPGYGFAAHKGYGTRQHLDALTELGPCPIHRRSFRPVADLIEKPAHQADLELW